MTTPFVIGAGLRGFQMRVWEKPDPMVPPLTDAELAKAEAELRAEALAACVKKAELAARRNAARAFEIQFHSKGGVL